MFETRATFHPPMFWLKADAEENICESQSKPPADADDGPPPLAQPDAGCMRATLRPLAAPSTRTSPPNPNAETQQPRHPETPVWIDVSQDRRARAPPHPGHHPQNIRTHERPTVAAKRAKQAHFT